MKIFMKCVRFILIKIPAAIVLAVLSVFCFLFQYLSGVVALLLRIAGGLAILISGLVLISGLASCHEMILSAVGGAILILLPFLRTGVLFFLGFLTEGLKAVLLVK